jgi:hypothetical protein
MWILSAVIYILLNEIQKEVAKTAVRKASSIENVTSSKPER